MPCFDTDSNEIWPNPNVAPLNLSNFGKSLLQQSENLTKLNQMEINIDDFIRKSAEFPIEFGTNTCRVMSQPKEHYAIIAEQIASAYPVIHERVLGLYLEFLQHKHRYGNEIEKKVYADLNLTGFVQRLLTKRCVCFLGHHDFYVLLDRQTGFGDFKKVGTTKEQSPLTLENVLSYDEMKLSALLSVSTHTEFLNDGSRTNSGIIETDKSKIEKSGVIVGFIGARFQMPEVMECQDILVSKKQNNKQNGYGYNKSYADTNNRNEDYRRIWNEFYEEPDHLYKTAKDCGKPRFVEHRKYGAIKERIFFDNLLMKKRYSISFDTLLLEAEARAAAAGKQAYVHVVGIGLGVWKAASHQEELFFETFRQRLKALLPRLQHIGVIHFSWFILSEWQDLKDGVFIHSKTHPHGGIRVFISRRNPAEKLPAEFENMLVVASFAWDSNALPGNEFWEKCLSHSSDSSTASSTLITELMNPHINTSMVNGENLHIATQNNGVMHIKDYCQNILKLF